MRIGILTSLTVANSAYRAFPLAELTGRGHELILADADRRLDGQPLLACDVVHVYRQSDPPIRRLVRQLHDAGVGVVWDVDDDLTAEPEEVEGSWSKRGTKLQRMLSDVLAVARAADVMTTTTGAIATTYRRHGVDPVRVVENYLPTLYATPTARPHDGVTIGWVAANEHSHDLRHLGIKPMLERVLEANPDARVHCIGIDLGLDSDRYRRDVVVEYSALGARVAEFDVGIAPLDDIPFNRARSNVKVKEYAAAGVPWLASPIGPYANLGEKQGGRLVPDDGWEAALTRLVRKDRERRKLAKRALEWGASQRAARNLGAWEAVLEEAVQRARLRSSEPRGLTAAL
ncbi:glycosyltransferase [Conexibacter stalactiti]|uniref:Glycosyltransferase n=1 Tax=Conexibacter stalactiti TaxID=1940611 RepID=A0ABU4HQK8_9ACTN|nr:glycosyltransferase [Conexibacter stalactiti]MDW5595509.1 glycosyltransferase [Conexibacter stalactiti]MEC5036151.1 glycosyltransferase [Conexibacter stalactiti]